MSEQSVPQMGDVLGDEYEVRALSLPGDARATLVRLAARRQSKGAVLHLHGFADYFFQSHVAEHFALRGYDFYALDLRGYGRSLSPDELPNFVTDLTVYFADLDAAVGEIRSRDGHSAVTLLAHSTGGLVASLWAHERREARPISALVLNSPWLDYQGSALMRGVGTWFVRLVGRVRPRAVLRAAMEGAYGASLHRTREGEWEYDLQWKPLAGFPVRAGWLAAVRRGHARVHRGLDVRVPVLVLHSGRSLLTATDWSADSMTADTVLDVRQIARWAPKIGPDVAVVEVEGALHDVFLSAGPVRRLALIEVDDWMDARSG